MTQLVLGLLCLAFAALNIAFVIYGNPALAPISILAAVAGTGAGLYSLRTWSKLR